MKNKDYVKRIFPNAYIEKKSFHNPKYSTLFKNVNWIWHHDSEKITNDYHITYYMIHMRRGLRHSDVLAASCMSAKAAWKFAAEKIQQDIIDILAE